MLTFWRQATVIGKGLKIVGNIEADGSVKIDGKIEGEVHCTVLLISSTAQVIGSIDAVRVVVDGRVLGPIRAKDVLLKSQAKIEGDIYCNTLAVEKGAWVDGRLIRVPISNADTTTQLDVVSRGKTSKRTDDLVVEARQLSGNPSLPPDEAVALVAKSGNGEAKAFLKTPRKIDAGFSPSAKAKLTKSSAKQTK
jgi:cytoskeletal protein CcmA (bactofilin family)